MLTIFVTYKSCYKTIIPFSLLIMLYYIIIVSHIFRKTYKTFVKLSDTYNTHSLYILTITNPAVYCVYRV